MSLRWYLLGLAFVVAACNSEQVADRYRAERDVASVEFRYLKDKRGDRPLSATALRNYAEQFEAAAMKIAAWSATGTPAVQAAEGRAWLRAAECHFATLDSGRAELILATLAANHPDLPAVSGPVDYQRGLAAESRREYPKAIELYRRVVESVVPDPGPDPDEIFDPDAIPEEKTVDDFVLGLPLRSIRLALRDSSITDTGPLYADATYYYRGLLGDSSAFVRIEATRLLAEVEADEGNWRTASTLLDSLEHSIPLYASFHYPAWEIRFRSFEYQVKAHEWGQCTEDSLRTLLAVLVEDYPRGEAAPSAVFAVARSEASQGDLTRALTDLHRLRRDWPTSRVVPDAELLRGQLVNRSGDRVQARQILTALAREYPTSEAALLAPMELAAQCRSRGDLTGEQEALVAAESQYRAVLDRYPKGEHTLKTHELLVQTLTLLGQHGAAIDALLAMCKDPGARAAVPSLLLEAARRAETYLGDTGQAARLYEQVADEFPDTRVGRHSVRDVRRLRQEGPKNPD